MLTTSAAASAVRETVPVDDTAPIGDDELDALFAAFRPYDVVVLAVSGGADSTALMHLATRWRRRQLCPPHLIVASIDHGLRPASATEAIAVGQAASALGLPHHCVRWEGPKPASGIQAAARAARYRLLHEIVRTHLAAVPPVAVKQGPRGAVATGHTLDDQAETFIMRLARGSGVDGLSAMAPVSTVPIEAAAPDAACDHQKVALLRPLLSIARARLVASLRQYHVAFADDPSNADPSFERVRIRDALTALAAAGVSPSAIARSAERLRHTRTATEHIALDLINAAITQPFGLYLNIDSAKFQAADDDSGLRAFRRALETMGGAAPAATLKSVERAYEHLFRNRLDEADQPTPLTLGGCHVVPRSEATRTQTGTPLTRVVHIYREAHRAVGLPVVPLLPGNTTYWDKRFLIVADPNAGAAMTVAPLGPNWAVLKSLYPDLERLALPAAAARTMPCVRTADGRFACPALASAAAELRQQTSLARQLHPHHAHAALGLAIPDLLDRAALGTLPEVGSRPLATVTATRSLSVVSKRTDASRCDAE